MVGSVLVDVNMFLLRHDGLADGGRRVRARVGPRTIGADGQAHPARWSEAANGLAFATPLLGSLGRSAAPGLRPAYLLGAF